MHAAIVTGDSRGLGEALAAELLDHGCRVFGIGRSTSQRLSGERHQHVACDLSQPALIESAVLPRLQALASERPSSVTLINNAAVTTPIGRIGRLRATEIEAALATNIAAPFVMADLFCRAFRDDTMPRRIINISSGAAQTAIAGSAAYSIAKAALEMLTRSIVADYPGSSLECITLRPGIFDTGMQQLMRVQDPADLPGVEMFRSFKEQGLLKNPADVARRIVAKLVLGPVENGRTYQHTDLEG